MGRRTRISIRRKCSRKSSDILKSAFGSSDRRLQQKSDHQFLKDVDLSERPDSLAAVSSLLYDIFEVLAEEMYSYAAQVVAMMWPSRSYRYEKLSNSLCDEA
ncbi:Hypp3830 [Branchiostoma lanceolatum]|uniref:Hypp3830 protein n=1 Tax=Branchiostoma lanceolatum TaxID=7740 RepID=A0A8K0A5C6_BRALA|nr:Hypp3830 [Branchiostoma lanceolatum]